MICKICKQKLDIGEEYLCDSCLNRNDIGAVSDVIRYIKEFIPLPINENADRIVARSVVFCFLDRIYDQPFDDPVDLLLDFAIEIHEWQRIYDFDDEELYSLNIQEGTLSDLRKFLNGLGYGTLPRSRY